MTLQSEDFGTLRKIDRLVLVNPFEWVNRADLMEDAMLHRTSILVVLAMMHLPANVGAEEEESFDDFVSAHAEDVKVLGLAIVSQVDPAVAEANAAEMVRNHWAARPEAELAPEQAQIEVFQFAMDFEEVSRIIRERSIDSLSFVGLDLVLLKRAQDWYYGAATPRGPVLIRLSVQFYPDVPATIHGVRIWTEWEEVKAASAAIQIRAGAQVPTVTWTVDAIEEEEASQ